VGLCLGGASTALAQDEATDEEPAVYYVLFHSPGPEWNDEFSFREQPGIGAHVGYMAGLLERGLIVMGGPYLDDSGGMMVSRASSLEEAERLAHEDPGVQSGLLTVEVKAWYVPMASVE
jgi:uncharacterized protein YciI